MHGSLPFRLNRSGMLLALISAAFAGEAAAAAGRVDFTTAGVTVAGRDGQTRPLAKGTELDNGDTVRTSIEGRAQIRFSDGSYISLQPNTDFAISDYKFEGKDDDRGFFGLVKGAMRTVTGAVGRVNRNSYRITTPTATVGIRGTGGVIQVLPNGSTLVIGTSGIWSLTNPAGSIDIPAGVSGLAPTEPNTPPKETNTQPQTKPAEVEVKPVYVQGNEVNPDGTAAIIPPTTTPPATLGPLVSGSGFAPAAAFRAFEGLNPITLGGYDGGEGLTADAVFNPAGQLTEFTFNGALYKLGPTGSHADFGTDGILAWGRWTGPVSVDGTPENYPATNSGFHYVIGMPTPVMPTMGTATYSMIPGGATRPTDSVSSPGTFSNASLNVNFGTSRVGGTFDVAVGGNGYRVAWTQAEAQIIASRFTVSMTPTGIAGAACSCGCDAVVKGFFAGTSAERAGLAYHIQNNAPVSQNIFGAAAFKRD